MTSEADPDHDETSEAARGRGFTGYAADLRKAWAMGPRGWVDLMRAVVELAAANFTLRRTETSQLGILEEAQFEKAPDPGPDSEQFVDRVAFAMEAMAARVPWRSDCLVQAVAARRWLASGGVPSRIAIGARHGDEGDFMAHAWLTVGERVVTGGDIAPFEEFERPKRSSP